jgi:hypothetical protein
MISASVYSHIYFEPMLRQYIMAWWKRLQTSSWLGSKKRGRGQGGVPIPPAQAMSHEAAPPEGPGLPKSATGWESSLKHMGLWRHSRSKVQQQVSTNSLAL